jgi:hypothetical protein
VAFIRLLVLLLLVAPLAGLFFLPKFRLEPVRGQIGEAVQLYACLLAYLFCNMLHSELDIQKGIGNGLFDLPASFLTGVALGYAGLLWGTPRRTRLLRAVLAVVAGVSWFVLVPYLGK